MYVVSERGGGGGISSMQVCALVATALPCTSVIQHALWIALKVACGKQLHDAIDLLCFAWEVEAPQEGPVHKHMNAHEYYSYGTSKRRNVTKNALLYIVRGFWPKPENFDFGQKGYHMKGHLKRNRMTQISAS